MKEKESGGVDFWGICWFVKDNSYCLVEFILSVYEGVDYRIRVGRNGNENAGITKVKTF